VAIVKIAVIGTGYVGLVTGSCLANFGNDVLCVDVDMEKVENLNVGRVPFFEPGLADVLTPNLSSSRLAFTTDLAEAVNAAEMVFITVGTPPDPSGAADLSTVWEVARSIGRCMEDGKIVVTKSTVPVGTTLKVKALIAEELSTRGRTISYEVANNPEFLREGSAVLDFMNPDRVVVGTESEKAREALGKLYSFLDEEKLLFMDILSSEMTKYTANALLATKISFMNEIAGICESVGADVEKVRLGIGSDSRIGYAFISPGCGYGGSCFPKDVRALIRTATGLGYNPRILEAGERVNHVQKHILFKKIAHHFEETAGKTIAIWGLSFKPNTSDTREASSLVLIEDLLNAGARVKAHDPVAMPEARKAFPPCPGLEYTDNHLEAVRGADALVLVTEWDLYKQPDLDRLAGLMASPVVFDGRNQYNPQEMKRHGFTYYSIGRPAVLGSRA
jgi:UDPglucose 6-dehydrogenase